MEYINRIELQGYIGNVRVTNVADTSVARLQIATELCYKNRSGEAVIDTTWHNVAVWNGRGCSDVTALRKGARAHVTGRLRNQRYVGSDGVERSFCEILADNVTMMED